ncbi:MAG TPA: hypothetical protein PLE99_10625 [Candidatus Thiothrix moscowensis]|uniref:hypothetical protein n=1 Tax=unclassified Thiothrix TaxID=2636184 RepID=UPI0025D483E4|nr:MULTISPECIES: hypothetical protein [unclassified Thiothrix]HRJ53213.1 hypothetical protein [Candidatus Thiothrix moscowensis]HRJ93217.1 hypothetical protein [Candidatus Thiothrix moscowensis]
MKWHGIMAKYQKDDQHLVGCQPEELALRACIYIEHNEKYDMLMHRIKTALQWLPTGCELVRGQTLDEAYKLSQVQNYDIFITDSDVFYKLIVDIKIFKLKIEEDFFSNYLDPLLDTKPLHYSPNRNTLAIREKNAHNSRFLYEIFKLVLTPPLLIIKTSQLSLIKSDQSIAMVRHAIESHFPYIKVKDSIDMSSSKKYTDNFNFLSMTIETHAEAEIKPYDTRTRINITICNHIGELKKRLLSGTQSLNADQKIDGKNICQATTIDPLEKNDYVNLLWDLNSHLEHNGYLALYNDKMEILNAYSHHLKMMVNLKS